MSTFTKVSGISAGIQENILKTATNSGFAMTGVGAAAGGVYGGIEGSFSEYGGFFGGATKGAIAGGMGGAGLKYATTRYSRGFEKSVGESFADTGISSMAVKERDEALTKILTPDFSHFKGSSENWFNTTYTPPLKTFQDSLDYSRGLS